MAKPSGGANPVAQHWVRLAIPAQFRLGARTIAERCGWRIREESGGLRVCTDENYRRTAPQLLTLDRIADARTVNDLTAFNGLLSWVPQDRQLSDHMRRRVAEDLRRRVEAAQLPDILYALRLTIFNARDAALPEAVQDALRFVLSRSLEASAWGIRIEARLQWRFVALRALLAAADTPEILARDAEAFQGFPAAKGLMADTMGLDRYLAPALLALSPGVHGIATARVGGTVVLLFGDAILGLREAPAAEVLQLYLAEPMTSAAALSAGGPAPTAAAVEVFFRWYVGRLNDLFGRVLDPARFRTADGSYDVGRHFAAVLSVERLFLCTQDILAGVGRLEFLRQLLLFQVASILEGLTDARGPILFTLQHAKARWDELVATLPSEARAVVEPRCLAALAALEHVQRGFHVTERMDARGLRRRRKHGGEETIALDRAAGEYLWLLRNATHGFYEHVEKVHQRSLLVAHTGELHRRLPDLAFLLVLHALARPDVLKL